jgi:pimeloyl-ACP methyl ester carboxylesterase
MPVNTKRKNRNEVMLPAPHKFTIALYENVTLQGYRWGKSTDPMVLLVHGWSTSPHSMTHFIKALLLHGYQVISYDAVAHGESQKVFSDLSSWADSVQAVMKQTGEVECIVAHSFGAAAVTVASKLGLETKKLVFIAPIHNISLVIERFAKTFAIPPAIVRKLPEYTWEYNQESFSKYAKNFKELLHSNRHLPTLLIHDENDKEIGIEHSLELCKIWPWAKLIRTKGLGHRSILDDAGVAKEVLDFIAAPIIKLLGPPSEHTLE